MLVSFVLHDIGYAALKLLIDLLCLLAQLQTFLLIGLQLNQNYFTLSLDFLFLRFDVKFSLVYDTFTISHFIDFVSLIIEHLTHTRTVLFQLRDLSCEASIGESEFLELLIRSLRSLI